MCWARGHSPTDVLLSEALSAVPKLSGMQRPVNPLHHEMYAGTIHILENLSDPFIVTQVYAVFCG